jgi:quercetin dioxygenase-like cupin family protein
MQGSNTVVVLALAAMFGFQLANAQQPGGVDSKGQNPKLKLEKVIAGHLTELNGRYKLRVTEVTYVPGGYIGPHHHVGPGIRCVTSGDLTYVQPDATHIYRAGDCFYETGDVSHTASNATDKPVVLLNFEVVPASHSGGTAIPVRK